jgi:hypothetical protein
LVERERERGRERGGGGGGGEGGRKRERYLWFLHRLLLPIHMGISYSILSM